MIISGESSRIAEMINSMGIEVRNLLKAAVEIAYFSRGSIQYEQVLQMTPLERDITVEFINKRLELASKMPFPVF
jgi:hypothetical protein